MAPKLETIVLNSHKHNHKIGQVFTPFEWAIWLILKWNIFDLWVNGASICDPTAGEGVFMLALFKLAKDKNIEVTDYMLCNMWLVDICSTSLEQFQQKAQHEYGITFPSSNLLNQDLVLSTPEITVDILIGNPPWCNFTDLPIPYRDIIKEHFIYEGLIPDTKKALLGSSRTDIASLIVKVAIGKLLKKDGMAVFFLPTSLFLGDEAHKGFRYYVANNRKFSIKTVYEFSITKVFLGVNTQYCCAKIDIDVSQEFPVNYFRETTSGWKEHNAYPLNADSDQWLIIDNDSERNKFSNFSLKINNNQQPRQGVNSCGANEIFIFNNTDNQIPKEFLFPLLTKDNWKSTNTPTRWIMLLYDRTNGKPLTWEKIATHPSLVDYLMARKSDLINRKGTLIRASINRGYWWAALGVGPYSFAPFKVVWEAYGKTRFNPIVVSSYSGLSWQGNQALHAFIPCWSEDDAIRVQRALDTPLVTDFLKHMHGEGKCNWAQPGKIKKLLSLNCDV